MVFCSPYPKINPFVKLYIHYFCTEITHPRKFQPSMYCGHCSFTKKILKCSMSQAYFQRINITKSGDKIVVTTGMHLIFSNLNQTINQRRNGYFCSKCCSITEKRLIICSSERIFTEIILKNCLKWCSGTTNALYILQYLV